ncbi:MAG TPA: choice-of-anchor tandem repeat GloVer-containing protein [Verrucomicrobiae bacterium]|nr:choice-of-anchor tandem repeat GloVer-containing protein [Verrucomicrobiae bacterium]
MRQISLTLTAALLILTLNLATSRAQTLNVVHAFTPATYSAETFTNSDGAHPYGSLVFSGNRLYGTTEVGGLGMGTIFAVNTDGSDYTVFHAFTGDWDGSAPYAGLALAGNSLYGTTPAGSGTVYSINTDGNGYQVLHAFDTNLWGGGPYAGLAVSGGVLYGTTQGNLFALDTDGNNYTVLHTFTDSANDPALSLDTNWDGSVCMASLAVNGNLLYGTTYEGGSNGCGTVFAVQTNGSNFTVLHAFAGGSDAANPWAGLLLAGNTLYGTTYKGGTNGGGTVFAINIDGSNYMVLHDFGGSSDGANPRENLILSGGTLYGTTSAGGTNGAGIVFDIGTNGMGYNILRALDNSPDGDLPLAGLALAGNTLYGTASEGGTNGTGTIFSLALPGAAIASFGFAGTSLIVNATNGIAGGTYAVLASDNLTLPMSQWAVVARGGFDVNGNSSLVATNAVDSAAARCFYRLRVP